MQFAQVFWNSNFGDYSGFDSVCEYVRSGRHACSAVADFLKARAQIEEAYAKQLAALAKSQASLKLEGTMGKSWDCILSNAQKSSQCHQKLADVFNQHSQMTNQLTKTLKLKAKQKEEEVRHCQNECRSLYDKALKTKTEFIKRADQKRVLEEEREQLKRESMTSSTSQITSAKEIQKLDTSIRKVVSTAEATRQQCVNILIQLDVAKEQWESKTADVLHNYHDMEKSRIIYLRGLFWTLMNAICQTSIDVDKDCDAVRNVISKCDPDTDLQEFVTLRKTGEKRPGPITFDNIGNTNASNASQRSFKAFGKRLGNAWKSANGHTVSANVDQKAVSTKLPPTPKQQTHRGFSGRRKHKSREEITSSPEACSASTSPLSSPDSPNSEPEIKYGSNIGYPNQKPTIQVHQKVKRSQLATPKATYVIVLKTWADNQGTILVQEGCRPKLLEKSSDALWLIELEDHQTLYCPVEYLQEIW